MRGMHHVGPRPDLSPIAEPQTGAAGRKTNTGSVRLRVVHEHDHDTAVLSVHGEIDLETAPALREALLPILEHHAGPVVMDLSDIAFMDSTGVHILVETLQRLTPQNRPLAIVCLEGGPVHRLLGLLGLLDTMVVHRSRKSALIGGDDLLRSEPRDRATARSTN